MTAALALKPANLHPLETMEQIAARHEWLIERSADDEVTMVIGGSWADMHLALNWNDHLEALHLACTFDIKVPEKRRDEVVRLTGLINEQLYLGHFDIWHSEGTLLFRNALLLSGQAEMSEAQCEALVITAVEACERYYPAFQFVIWAGKTAEQAVQSCLLETVGEA